MASHHTRTRTGRAYPPSRDDRARVKARVGTLECLRVYRDGCTRARAPKAHDVLHYDTPSPEAMRKTATRNELPGDQITLLRVLDPYIYP
jgi:hypothetical protein